MNTPKGLLYGLSAAALLSIVAIGTSGTSGSDNDSSALHDISSISEDIGEGAEGILNADATEAADVSIGSGVDIDDDYSEEPLDKAVITIQELANMAKNGDLEAAEWVVEYCESNFEKSEKEKLEEVGISKYEYEIFQNAVEFVCFRGIIDNQEGAADEIAEDALENHYRTVENEDIITWLNRGYFWSALNVLCKRAEKDGGVAYNSLFLKLIGMNDGELKDFAQQIYSYFSEEKVGEELKERLEYFKQVYELEAY